MRPKLGRFKYTISRKDRRFLVVDVREHELLRAYAKQEDISMVEATHYILGQGFTQITDLPPRKPWWKN